jgi:P-type Ca2+ transporter type 2C
MPDFILVLHFQVLKVIESQGAVESLLERSSYVQLADGSLVPIDDQCRELLLQRLHEMSSKGLRCLGLACKDELGEFSDYYADTHPAHKKLLDPTYYSSIESDLVFVGVVGLRVSFHYTFINLLLLQLLEDIN